MIIPNGVYVTVCLPHWQKHSNEITHIETDHENATIILLYSITLEEPVQTNFKASNVSIEERRMLIKETV